MDDSRIRDGQTDFLRQQTMGQVVQAAYESSHYGTVQKFGRQPRSTNLFPPGQLSGSAIFEGLFSSNTIDLVDTSGDIEINLRSGVEFYRVNIDGDATFTITNPPRNGFEFTLTITFTHEAPAANPILMFPGVRLLPDINTEPDSVEVLKFSTSDQGLTWTVINAEGILDASVLAGLDMELDNLRTEFDNFLMDPFGTIVNLGQFVEDEIRKFLFGSDSEDWPTFGEFVDSVRMAGQGFFQTVSDLGEAVNRALFGVDENGNVRGPIEWLLDRGEDIATLLFGSDITNLIRDVALGWQAFINDPIGEIIRFGGSLSTIITEWWNTTSLQPVRFIREFLSSPAVLNAWEGVVTFFQNLAAGVVRGIEIAGELFANFTTSLRNAFDATIDFFSDPAGIPGKIVGFIFQTAQNIGEFFNNIFSNAYDFVSRMITGLFASGSTFISRILTALFNGASSVFQWLSDNVFSSLGDVGAWLTTLPNSIRTGIRSIGAWLGEQDVPGALFNWLINIPVSAFSGILGPLATLITLFDNDMVVTINPGDGTVVGDVDIRTFDLTNVDRIFFNSNDGIDFDSEFPHITGGARDMALLVPQSRNFFFITGDRSIGRLAWLNEDMFRTEVPIIVRNDIDREFIPQNGMIRTEGDDVIITSGGQDVNITTLTGTPVQTQNLEADPRNPTQVNRVLEGLPTASVNGFVTLSDIDRIDQAIGTFDGAAGIIESQGRGANSIFGYLVVRINGELRSYQLGVGEAGRGDSVGVDTSRQFSQGAFPITYGDLNSNTYSNTGEIGIGNNVYGQGIVSIRGNDGSRYILGVGDEIGDRPEGELIPNLYRTFQIDTFDTELSSQRTIDTLSEFTTMFDARFGNRIGTVRIVIDVHGTAYLAARLGGKLGWMLGRIAVTERPLPRNSNLQGVPTFSTTTSNPTLPSILTPSLLEQTGNWNGAAGLGRTGGSIRFAIVVSRNGRNGFNPVIAHFDSFTLSTLGETELVSGSYEKIRLETSDFTSTSDNQPPVFRGGGILFEDQPPGNSRILSSPVNLDYAIEVPPSVITDGINTSYASYNIADAVRRNSPNIDLRNAIMAELEGSGAPSGTIRLVYDIRNRPTFFAKLENRWYYRLL